MKNPLPSKQASFMEIAFGPGFKAFRGWRISIIRSFCEGVGGKNPS